MLKIISHFILIIAINGNECSLLPISRLVKFNNASNQVNFIFRHQNLMRHSLMESGGRISFTKTKYYKKKQQSLESLLSLEIQLRSNGYRYVVGSDDSGGAGCIAGPVVVASSCLLVPFPFFSEEQSESSSWLEIPPKIVDTMRKVNDCKILTREMRREIYETVMSNPHLFAVSVSYRTPQQIDEINLTRATQHAFAESIENLVHRYGLPFEEVYAIVDGNLSPKLFDPNRSSESQTQMEQTCNLDRGTKVIPSQQGKSRFSVRPYINGDANVYTVALSSIIARVSRDDMMSNLHSQHPEYRFDVNVGYGSRDHLLAIHRYGALQGVHRFSFKQVKGR